ncbi:hypothetical protein [Flavobacterium cerinum]|uniref:T9SS type A sorting domain-containing protein n=1 Tax=Flavobacterium cerinum TaxID=2502784 RepID=A0A3S3QKX6_9FLAO|nr:hypothetical protein [Flavobacterium cerinum]RWX00212.1 hypothetical protein EPI11_10035 [Flavobacterium cerinum]
MTKFLLFVFMFLPFFGTSQEFDNFPPPDTNTGIYCNASTTWNGSAWSNGEPDANKDVIFNANYTCITGTFNACSIFVLDGAHINFNQGSNAIVTHSVNVAENAQLVFESSSNLIQIEETENTGNIIIKRKSSKIVKDDYTLWSSPVSGEQTLVDFSPETLQNHFYTFSTNNNIYNNLVNPQATVFTKAKGYLIRTPETHPIVPTAWEAQFEGTPNTGDINIHLVYANQDLNYNAVGNPYPSPISIKAFIEANSDVIDGTVWLWRKTQDAAKSSYVTVTKLGYQSNDIVNINNPNDPYYAHPDGIINTGQGFMVRSKNTQELVFNNAMRLPVNEAVFFRPKNDEQPEENLTSRLWINVTGTGVFSQTLIGYTPQGSLQYDNGFDGLAVMDGGVTLYTVTNTKRFAIQARPEFNDTDVVPLGFKTQTAGTYQIALDHMDGLFLSGQHIYLKDKTDNTIHNLNEGNYTFTTNAGTFENRFEIVYTETLGTNLPAAPLQETIIYTNNNQVKVHSTQEIMSIALYDISGRLIYSQNNINAFEFSSSYLNITKQIVIAKTILSNKQIVTKNIVIQ